jgi:hypothetical protein
MKATAAAALLAAACAGAGTGRAHVGPVTGRARVAGRTFTCSQAGLFVDDGGGARFLGDPGVRPFALAAGDAGLLVGGGEPAQSGELALCDLDGRVRQRARVADDLVYAVAFAPRGAAAAAACADGRVLLVALPGLDGARTRWQHGGAAVAVAFAPDGAMLASGGHDGVLLLGAADGDAPPQRLVDHTAAVTCLAWSADGALLASGARDGKVRLHDRTGRLLHTWQRLGGAIVRVGFRGKELAFAVAGAPGEGEREGVVYLP